MTRPDLDTLACVNPECQRFRRPGEANLTVRKVYGHDRLRLLRCHTCGEEFSAPEFEEPRHTLANSRRKNKENTGRSSPILSQNIDTRMWKKLLTGLCETPLV